MWINKPSLLWTSKSLWGQIYTKYTCSEIFLKIGLLLSDTVPRGELQITMMAEQKNTPSKLTRKKRKLMSKLIAFTGRFPRKNIELNFVKF